MAEKSLTESQVKELLTNGRTGTIRGFKSKTGKKFDARVALNRDEGGKVTGLKFDFTDLEPVKVKDVKCPLCGGRSSRHRLATAVPITRRTIRKAADLRSEQSQV